uniref:L-fucose mutarotase n=1 Tax=Erpetoichthys calabaricus TaxID=27687 RepID=A0A8C4TJX8_ERPCA
MVVLKGIPAIISPELYTLAKMGHGDELILADVNFPVSSICRFGPTEIRADGLGGPQLLEAILKLFPIDTYLVHASFMSQKQLIKQYNVGPWSVFTGIRSLCYSLSSSSSDKIQPYRFKS